jgi:hypothetical protein
MKEYLAEQEAGIKLSSLVVSFLKKSCPVFQKECLGSKCHSYYRGGVHKVKKQKNDEIVYVLNEPNCSCSLVTGSIEMLEP